MLRLCGLVTALAAAMGCSDNASSQPQPAPAPIAKPAGSGSSGSATTKPTPGDVDARQTGSGSGSAAKPVIHGDKWSSDDEGGGKAFKAFKETWVYVDGVPRGVLLFAEMPPGMPHTWKDDVEGLDFKPGDKGPHEKKIQILRWRLADYLKTIGVDIAKIKVVYLHGSGYVAIPGDQFRKFADGIQFDFTGNDLSKSRFYWPTTMKTNTTYDRYAAVSVFVEKPPMTLDRHNNPYIDGQEVGGIPYHGTPERGGFRVYVDNRLAMVIKRNELGATGMVNKDKPDEDPKWSVLKLLEARGVKVAPVAGDLVVSKDFMNQKRTRLAEDYVKDLQFTQSSETSGGLLLGKDKLQGTALYLHSKGHVPKDVPLPPLERDWSPIN
jgi:hypothetical protein